MKIISQMGCEIKNDKGPDEEISVKDNKKQIITKTKKGCVMNETREEDN